MYFPCSGRACHKSWTYEEEDHRGQEESWNWWNKGEEPHQDQIIWSSKHQVNEKRANYDAEKGLFVGLTFDSEDPVEQLDAVSIAPTEATEVDEDEDIADDADQENDDLEEVESEEVEEPENNEDDGDDEEAAEDMDGTDENAKEDDMDDDDMDWWE